MLGLCYLEGVDGYEHDIEKGLELLEQAAENARDTINWVEKKREKEEELLNAKLDSGVEKTAESSTTVATTTGSEAEKGVSIKIPSSEDILNLLQGALSKLKDLKSYDERKF